MPATPGPFHEVLTLPATREEDGVKALLEHPTLAKYGLSVNMDHLFIACLGCMTAVQPSQIQQHRKDMHWEEGIRANKQELDQALAELNIPLQAPLPSFSPHYGGTPVAGLKIYKGQQCKECHYCSGAPSMQKHFMKEHPGLSNTHVWPVSMQRLQSRGSHSAFFSVIQAKPPLHSDSVTTLVEQVLGQEEEHLTLPVYAEDAREISPWLISSGWINEVKGFATHDLTSLVAAPKPGDPLMGVAMAVEQWMHAQSVACKQLHLSTLKHIHTPEWEKG